MQQNRKNTKGDEYFYEGIVTQGNSEHVGSVCGVLLSRLVQHTQCLSSRFSLCLSSAEQIEGAIHLLTVPKGRHKTRWPNKHYTLSHLEELSQALQNTDSRPLNSSGFRPPGWLPFCC